MSVKLKKNCRQEGISNLFRKNFKTSAHFRNENWRKQKLAKHAAQVNVVTTINSKTLAFSSLL